jgi:hypothetical protein
MTLVAVREKSRTHLHHTLHRRPTLLLSFFHMGGKKEFDFAELFLHNHFDAGGLRGTAPPPAVAPMRFSEASHPEDVDRR